MRERDKAHPRIMQEFPSFLRRWLSDTGIQVACTSSSSTTDYSSWRPLIFGNNVTLLLVLNQLFALGYDLVGLQSYSTRDEYGRPRGGWVLSVAEPDVFVRFA